MYDPKLILLTLIERVYNTDSTHEECHKDIKTKFLVKN